MSVLQKDGVKFGCLCLGADDTVHDEDAKNETALGQGFHLARPWPEFDVHVWREALGSWRLSEIRDADVWIWATEPSNALHVDNAENEKLSKRLREFWQAVQLSEPPLVRLHGYSRARWRVAFRKCKSFLTGRRCS